MKAERSNFNGEWFKDCSKCKAAYASDSLLGLKNFFHSDCTSSDGLNCICKVCCRAYYVTKHKRYYKQGTLYKKKHDVRRRTREKFGSAGSQKCEECGKKAHQWHHLRYTVDAAIALCKPCHESQHSN